jgi:hypothetical protein
MAGIGAEQPKRGEDRMPEDAPFADLRIRD